MLDIAAPVDESKRLTAELDWKVKLRAWRRCRPQSMRITVYSRAAVRNWRQELPAI
jgi:hypothetical protein